MGAVCSERVIAPGRYVCFIFNLYYNHSASMFSDVPVPPIG